MNSKANFKICVILIIWLIAIQKSNAQWANFPTTLGNTYNQTNQLTNEESVGIGDFNGNFPSIPLSALHINTNFFNTYGTLPSYPLGEVFRTDGPGGIDHAWRMFSGNNVANEKFSLINPNGVNDIYLNTTQNGQMRFFTDIANPTGPVNYASPADRMRIDRELRNVVDGNVLFNGNYYLTRVGITEGGNNTGNAQDWTANPHPVSLLHLGTAWQQNLGMHRMWMDVGTFTIAGTDGMYVGLKQSDFTHANRLWTDHMNSVIVWGDNINTPEGADFMQIIFNARQVPASGHAGNVDGLEVMRFTPRARVGIGNFSPVANGSGSGISPQRRLEIYDEHLLQTDASHFLAAASQLRLTYTPDATVTNGIWTDFQTTSNGDLYIHPSNDGGTGTPVNQNVGINTSAPGNTLEINSTIGASPRPAGLRFSNLNSSSANDIASNGRVLTVDNNGDVCLTGDVGGGSLNACTGSLIGHVTLFTPTANEICNSEIFQNWSTGNTFVGIHNTNPLYYLHNTGTSMFEFAAPSINYPTYNAPMDYPLAVKSNFVGGDDPRYSYSGIGVFAEGNALAAQYNLNIFANTNGEVFHLTIGPNTYFNDKYSNEDMLAFSPSMHSTIISDDYSANPAILNALLAIPGDNARLYVEGSDKVIGINDVAVWGNNISAGSLNGRTIVGMAGTSATPCLGCNPVSPTLTKIGGNFIASDADGRSPQCYGVHGTAIAGATHTYPGYYAVGGLFEASGSDYKNIGALGGH